MKEMTEDQKIELLKGATIFDIFLGLMQTEEGAVLLQVNSELIQLKWNQIMKLPEINEINKDKVIDYHLGGKR